MFTRNHYLAIFGSFTLVLCGSSSIVAAPGIGGPPRATMHVTPEWNPVISGWTWKVPVTGFWFDAESGHSLDAMLDPPPDENGQPNWSTDGVYQLYQEVELMPPSLPDVATSPLTFWQQAWVTSDDPNQDSETVSATWTSGAITSQWADPIGMGRPAPELFHEVALLGTGNEEFWFLFQPVNPPHSADEVMTARIWNGFRVPPDQTGPLRVRAFAIPEPQGIVLVLFALLAVGRCRVCR